MMTYSSYNARATITRELRSRARARTGNLSAQATSPHRDRARAARASAHLHASFIVDGLSLTLTLMLPPLPRWVVTNDRWTDHRASRHATEPLRKRRISYAFVGGAFSPASDDIAHYDAAAPAAC